MSPGISFVDRLSIGASAIAGFLLVVFFLLGLPIILAWLNPLLAIAGGISLVLATVAAVICWLFRRRRSPSHPLRIFVKAAAAAFMAVVGLMALPVYYLSFEVDAHPSALPQVTLTNGTKTVVYQGMVHVGSEPFYKSVVYDLEKALVEGFTLFYEGVQPSPGEGDQWFSRNLAGGGDLSENYRMLGSVCELKFQLEYFALLSEDMKARPERHVVADVTTLDMKREYDRLLKSDPSFAARMSRRPAREAAEPNSTQGGLTDSLIDRLKPATSDQSRILGILCRGAINMAIGQGGDEGDLEPIVLDFRNRNLAATITKHPANKIYITYGAAHLPGMIALLKAQDPQWRIVSSKWVRAIGTPEHLTGRVVLQEGAK